MSRDQPEMMDYVLVGFVGAIVVFFGLSSLFRARDPNTTLAETARKAVEMAEEARKDAESVRRASSAFRIVALVVGVTIPLVVAYLVYKLRAREEVGMDELVQAFRQYRLTDFGEGSKKQLPMSVRFRIREGYEGKDQREGKG